MRDEIYNDESIKEAIRILMKKGKDNRVPKWIKILDKCLVWVYYIGNLAFCFWLIRLIYNWIT